MAVFTPVSQQQAQALFDALGLGTLTHLQGCAGGIENTNYFASSTQGDFVLTLFERLSFAQLPFYLHLMQHLAARGIPVPDPQPDAKGNILHTVLGKPACVVNRLRGASQLAPERVHCAAVGAMLARMHLAGQDYPRQQPNLRGLPWWNETVPVVLPYLNAQQAKLITHTLEAHNALAQTAAYHKLPRGPIHADLFRDNVMFEDAYLTGFFDFYFAGCDTWLFDIAVCLNDWCIDLATGESDSARVDAFLRAYQSQRALSADEQALLPALRRAAALRFWTSRLWDFYLPRDAAMLKPHDPTHFERVLRALP